MAIKKNIFLIAYLVASFYNVAAQQYSFVHYTPKDGLVNNRTRGAYQDSRGIMYFLTYDGLSVYDGAHEFEKYFNLNNPAECKIL